MEESFLKIQSEGSNYYLMTQLSKEENAELRMTIVDGVNVWFGTVSHEDLQMQAAAAEKGFSEFMSETKSAFSLDCVKSSREFCHTIEINADHARISWKQLLDHGIKFQLGTAKLYQEDSVNINTFLDVAVSQFMKMKENISDLSSTKDMLLSEREKTFKRFDECVLAKDEIEKNLYKKFTAVLNDKKAKIRELKQKCDELKRNDIKSESNDEDELTDDEPDQDVKRLEKKVSKLPAILDEEDVEEEAGPSAKRKTGSRRPRENAALRIPRKLSLPRPPKKEKSNSDQSSSRQSSNLDQSSEDFDNLMDLI